MNHNITRWTGVLTAVLTGVALVLSIVCAALAWKPNGLDARLAFTALMGVLVVIALRTGNTP